MRQRNFRRSFLSLMALLVLVFSLAFVGCDDDGGGGEDLEADDLAGRTFNNLDLGVFNSALEGQTATLSFGLAVGDTLPFRLTTVDVNGDQAVIEGTATVSTIEFTVSRINGSTTGGTSVILDGDPDDVTISVGDTFEVDEDIDTDADRQIITFTNPNTGFSQDFTFDNPQDTGSTGSTGG